jgi:YgiT-type zinc finger domain-containing protein
MKISSQPNEGQSKSPSYQCPECVTGVLRMEAVTYFTWLDKELITVPNFPAWVCDMCGRREFDSRAITWLNTLLNPSTGRSSNYGSRKRSETSPGDQPQT